jgi:hypothetical protein
MLNTPKGLHLLQIMSAGAAGSYAESTLQIPTSDQVVHLIQVGAQVLIALVTVWATARKALQELKSPVPPTAPNV